MQKARRGGAFPARIDIFFKNSKKFVAFRIFDVSFANHYQKR